MIELITIKICKYILQIYINHHCNVICTMVPLCIYEMQRMFKSLSSHGELEEASINTGRMYYSCLHMKYSKHSFSSSRFILIYESIIILSNNNMIQINMTAVTIMSLHSFPYTVTRIASHYLLLMVSYFIARDFNKLNISKIT